MPATTFNVRWPDNSVQACYSPSTVIREYLKVQQPYGIAEFKALCNEALHAASQRVEKKFGYACSSAMDQLSDINQKCDAFEASESTVIVTSFQP